MAENLPTPTPCSILKVYPGFPDADGGCDHTKSDPPKDVAI
jgi:hypothetical protein